MERVLVSSRYGRGLHVPALEFIQTRLAKSMSTIFDLHWITKSELADRTFVFLGQWNNELRFKSPGVAVNTVSHNYQLRRLRKPGRLGIIWINTLLYSAWLDILLQANSLLPWRCDVSDLDYMCAAGSRAHQLSLWERQLEWRKWNKLSE